MKLPKNHSIPQFQNLIYELYASPDDRLFSIHDMVSNQIRFTMRAIKGIRKSDKVKLRKNLLIAFSWLAAIANRLHIDLDKVIWHRFPYLCSYCGQKPCVCKKNKIKERVKIIGRNAIKPGTMTGFQKMFTQIYPPASRTLTDAGVHLAEETGEVDETIHIYLGEHQNNQFLKIENEIADWISCMFGAANSAGINIGNELEKHYSNNCHACHNVPCTCNFSFVAKYKS